MHSMEFICEFFEQSLAYVIFPITFQNWIHLMRAESKQNESDG